MRITVNTLVLALAALVWACGGKQEGHDHPHEDGTEHPEGETTEESAQPAAAVEEGTKATGLLGSYLELKNALVATRAGDAKTAAASLKENAGDNAELAALAAEISGSDDVEAQRASFEKVSAAVYELVKGGGNEIAVYKQYCPMALDNKGAFWLSSSEDIKNPYFGDKMLKCGSVQEVIAVN